MIPEKITIFKGQKMNTLLGMSAKADNYEAGKYEIMLSRITHVHTKSIAENFLSLHCDQYLTLANFLNFANLIEEG